MADDRNQKQPDYYNPDNFFADESFGTSLGDDYSSFFSDDEPNAGGDQPALADTGEQDLSSWLAETEKEHKQMFEAGTAGPSSDFWSIDNSAGQNSQGHGPRKDTGSVSQYGTQQPGTGGSQFAGQQPAGTNDGPVILGGIDGGKVKRKKSMLPLLLAAGIGIILIIAIIPAFLHKKTDPQPVTVIDEPDDGDDDTYVSYQEEEPDYGKNYNDYYTNQYIMA
ncbi:MAG TPA: hypothetical protein DCR16_04795, partial [Lachnospiraceae bacterium]|nr:hypothetical protein [Lachnospiraceae bacterium]